MKPAHMNAGARDMAFVACTLILWSESCKGERGEGGMWWEGWMVDRMIAVRGALPSLCVAFLLGSGPKHNH